MEYMTTERAYETLLIFSICSLIAGLLAISLSIDSHSRIARKIGAALVFFSLICISPFFVLAFLRVILWAA